MAGPEELKHFLADPEKYVPPLAPRKLPEPELLPKRHIPKDVKASQTIELKGYCPVTFINSIFSDNRHLLFIYHVTDHRLNNVRSVKEE
jgi:hypothetical protein